MEKINKLNYRIDDENKERIKLYNINESQLVRLSIIQVLSEDNVDLYNILFELDKINSSLDYIQRRKELLEEEIRKYEKCIKERNSLIDGGNPKENIEENIKKIRLKSVENIKSILSRGVMPDLNMIEFNALKADMSVDSYLDFLEENGVDIENLLLEDYDDV